MLRDTAVQRTARLDEKTVQSVAKYGSKPPYYRRNGKSVSARSSKVRSVKPCEAVSVAANALLISDEQRLVTIDENTILVVNNARQARKRKV